MEKKIKFSDKPGVAKIIYGAIIAILCISAIIVGIVAANNRKPPVEIPDGSGTGDNTPDDGNNQGGNEDDGNNEQNKPGDENDGKVSFISPVVGKVVKSHDLTVPVFSETLEEWRVHAGIDISCEEGADVFAAAAGEVEKVFVHPLMGYTVVIRHSENLTSVYSNLDANSEVIMNVGDKVLIGEKIGNVGDSSISELAEEPHLHFEVMLEDASVNPLDYFTEEAKKTSLGIVEEEKEA